MKFKNLSWWLTLVVVLTLLITFTACEAIAVNDESLTVHYIDVGQGDAILIQHKNGKTMLIDGGDRYDWVANKLTSYLHKQGIETVHAMVGIILTLTISVDYLL